jgi:hypothetical protein
VGNGNIVVLALSSLFGEVSGKSRVPMTNVLGSTALGEGL